MNQNILAVDAFKYLQQNKITSLLVVDGFNALIGATHIHDLIKMGLSY